MRTGREIIWREWVLRYKTGKGRRFSTQRRRKRGSSGGRGKRTEEDMERRLRGEGMTRIRMRWNEEDGYTMLQEEGRDPGAGWTRK
jgi:hypothetical protein